MKKILITGGAGFAGHHFVEHFLKNTDWDIIVLDKLSYAANGYDRLRDIGVFDEKRVKCFSSDFTLPISIGVALEISNVDYIIHMGAETHVDRSIEDPGLFVFTNVVGTYHMLEYFKKHNPDALFIYFSTDEVFGPAPPNMEYTEWDRYNSCNPYAATKAGGEELALSYANTYGLNILITHTMNMFGERQHPEKFIPLIIKKLLQNKEILVHADKTKENPGVRSYIHCRNVASAVHFLLDNIFEFEQSPIRSKINIVGEEEINNLELVTLLFYILRELGFDPLMPNARLIDFHSSRPGHDLRYSLDGGLLEAYGWKHPCDFHDSLKKTVLWFMNNKGWLGEDLM